MDSNDDDEGDNGIPPAEVVAVEDNEDEAAATMLSLVRGGDHRASARDDDDNDDADRGGGEGEEDDDDDEGSGGDSDDGDDDDDDDDDPTVPLAEVIELDDDDDDDDDDEDEDEGEGEDERDEMMVAPPSPPLPAVAAAATVVAPAPERPSSSVRLAGFADASPPKSSRKAWQLFAAGWGAVSSASAPPPPTTLPSPSVAASSTMPVSENNDVVEMMTEAGGVASTEDGGEEAGEMEEVEKVEEEEEEGGDDIDDDNDDYDKITVTPAAGAAMDAITDGANVDGPEAIAVALLDEEYEGEEDAATDEVMRELRRDDDDDGDDDDDEKEEERGEGATTTTSDPIEEAARRAAASLNREALLSTHESNYAALQRERDGLRGLLVRRDAEAEERALERDRLHAELEGVKAALRRMEGETAKAGMVVVAERASHEGTRAELMRASERADRIDREADGLRAEISRLAKSNEESNALLSAMTNQHSQSSSEAMPLKLQVRRLERELDAVASHSNYLDGELSNRNEIIAALRREHSTEVRSLRSELDDVRLTLERTELDLTSARLVNVRASQDVERMQGRMRDAEMEHSSRRELLERDLDKERELAAMKDQRALFAEDRSAALSREVEELKELAREATEGATAQAEEMRTRWAEVVDDAVRAAREEEGRKLADAEERLRRATEASARMEEIIMDGSPRRSRTIEGDGGGTDDSTSPMRLLDSAGGGDGPLGLTDLYARLAEAEDDLRSERRENQKLKIIIDRIQRDVAAKTPMIRRWQLEHESALEELDDANERLNYARREVTDIRADNQELEMLNGRLERECAELKRENVDLATQVQSLLQRRCAESAGDMVSFDDITSLQQQNQKLLRDHNSMTEKIAELEDKIRNDPDTIELASLRSEVGSLREEREKQATLVAGIVHQRDLYRALVAKNDAPLIAYEGRGQDQLALVDARAEQLPLIEARNHNLVEEVAKLKAEVSCCKHEQVALESRLARVDSHANELTTSNERLRGDLTTAKATVARLEIDVSHYQGRAERLENSLAMVKSECGSESRRKTQAEDLLSKTQAHLEAVRGELAKKEQQYQQASSKMRLLEVQLETSVANEKRLESEAGALRAEIARQETLLSSVQRIEASLMAKAEGELENLREELKRVQETKSDDATKHDAAVQKMESKIADFEIIVKNLTVQKESATVSAAKATSDCSNLNLKVQELTLELKAAEKELKAAKIKLGDVTIDTSAEEALEAKVASLTAELESTKFELDTAQTRIVDYQAIAKSSEEQLADLTAASTKYKDETTAMLTKLRQSEKLQCETVAELTEDLMSYRGEKEKAVNELKATIDSLTSQLSGSREDAAKAISRTESLTAEARRYQLDAKNANVNYERELALHAEAREALRDARAGMESEQRLRETIESQLAFAQAEIATEKVAWDSSKTKLEESLLEAKSRLDDMRIQNNMLHDQMASLSATVEKFQSTKASALMGNEPSVDGAGGNPDAPGAVGEKQLSDLRELLRFKQSECAMLEADLASAKRASERERTAAELANRSLEEARSELKVLREIGKDDVGGASASEREMGDLRAKLNGAEEQLVLLRESNIMLREESQKVTKKLAEVQSQLDKLKFSTAPQSEKMKSMEVERASLEAEKESLSREVEAWKNRVHNLVSKFNQIDPEDYAHALATIDQLKDECSSLKTQKEISDANTTKAEGLVTRLNKEIESQKASIAAFKNALEKTKKEKEELSKAASSNKITNMKIAAAQATTKKAEEELKTSKGEVLSLTKRIENFKTMMLKMQAGLKDAKAKEEKAKATEVSLQKAISDLKDKLVAVNANTASSSSTAAILTETTALVSSTTSEKPHANQDAEMTIVPIEGAEKSEIQEFETAKTEAQEAPSTTDSSTETSAPDVVKPTLNTETNAQPVAKAETAARTSDTPAKEGETISADTDAAAAGKKKGRKRKANAPKKNASPGSEVEIVEAPPLKKVASQAVATKKETPSATEAQPAVEVSKVPPQQKTPMKVKKVAEQAVATKIETPSATEAQPAVEISKVPPQQKTPTQAKKANSSVTTAKPAAEIANAPSQKELEMKLKLELLKKRKAAALAKKMEAEKQLAEKQSGLSSDIDVSDKLTDSKHSESSAVAVDADEMAKAEARRRRFAKPEEGEKNRTDGGSDVGGGEGGDEINESESQTATMATSKQPLPSVAGKDTVEGAPDDSTSKPMLFGSSATLTVPPLTFDGLQEPPMQSEPDCPKPSFFGAASSIASKVVFGGAGPSASPFGGAGQSVSPSPFGGAAAKPPGGAFLNLTPPGVSGAGTTPGKFVFGKSANITLAVPTGASPISAAKTLASFGKPGLFGATPFGGGFGGPTSTFGTASPFGGGGGEVSNKRPLPAADGGEQPDAKQSRTEEEDEDGEIHDEGVVAETDETMNDAAAKEA